MTLFDLLVQNLEPSCRTCGGKPRVDAHLTATIDPSIKVGVVAECHGAREIHLIEVRPGFVVDTRHLEQKIFDAIPRKYFLKSWAGYSLEKPVRTGRLL